MYRQFGNIDYRNGITELGHDRATIAQSGHLDALVALERIGTRLSFSRNAEIHGDHLAQKAMTLLSGAKTDDLARFVEDLALLLGRAIQLVLAELTRPHHEGHRPRSV